MSAAHTPGPWMLWGRAEPSQAVAAVGGAFVAQTICGNDEPNARLIAAAPDLLEVLQEILSDGVHCDVVPHLHRKAIAAIAKATGAAS